MSDILKPCPFCGSENVKSGGDDKVVGSWCLNCGASGPNGYLTVNGDHDWNARAAPKVKPLVWEKLSERHYRCNMGGALNWRCESYQSGEWFLGYSVPGYSDQLIKGEWKTADEAKAVAQAHHDARILSALEGME